MNLDKDLASLQEVRDLVRKAKAAQKEYAKNSQEKIDKVVLALAIRMEKESEKLAKMAVEETGFGNAKDKVVKNIFASRMVYGAIKDMKTVGFIHEDHENKIYDIGVPRRNRCPCALNKPHINGHLQRNHCPKSRKCHCLFSSSIR